ncbi:uncharacterized protein LOC130564803 isoform X1 [Triplophysa rosa]|uniref:uncharacterized protein LOC130564803 isoform X1 n=1 Tax=Triplophysa rosa TaxID=992332 RepID=UPI002545C5A5|nr:uncharacterized protein LOC130564803 isoform X1 [Triplophysa rosa]
MAEQRHVGDGFQQTEYSDVRKAAQNLIGLLTQSLGQIQAAQGQQQQQQPQQPSSISRPRIEQDMARSFPGMFKKAKRKTPNPQIHLKATAWKPFAVSVYLMSQNTDTSPTPSEELGLLQAGLGKRVITISTNVNHSDLCNLLEAEFPKMRSLTGGWLLYKAPGGNGRRKLTVVPPDSEGYTGSLIKMATSAGRTALYMVPLQDKLCLDPLPFSAEEFAKTPRVECRTCKTTMPLPVLYLHVKSCGGGTQAVNDDVTTDDDDDEDVKVVGEISSAVSTTATTSMPIPTTSIQSCSPTPTTSFEVS